MYLSISNIENEINLGFPLWLNGLRTHCSLHEEVGSDLGLAQWVKDPMLLQAVV